MNIHTKDASTVLDWKYLKCF